MCVKHSVSSAFPLVRQFEWVLDTLFCCCSLFDDSLLILGAYSSYDVLVVGREHLFLHHCLKQLSSCFVSELSPSGEYGPFIGALL